MPVGEGAIRVTTGRESELADIDCAGSGEAAAHDRAWAAPLSTRIRTLPSAREIATWLARQLTRQAERWSLWTPVSLGLGSGLYFTLPREPQVWLAWLGAAMVGALLLLASRWRPNRGVTAALVLAACAIGGFSAAKLRTEHVKAPLAPTKGPPVRIEGWVLDISSPGQGGRRLLIAPARIGEWPQNATPIRVRVTLKGGYTPAPGEPISLLAVVNAPPQPASPGAYDFARDAYFQSIGGVGFALGTPQSWEPDAPPPWRLRLTMRVNAIRWTLTRRIVEAMGVEEGGLAAAMTTGHDAFIPPAQVNDLRAAGLAHIISISGLHMAIVGGFVFAGVRLIIAAWPWLALRIDGKKTAAFLGLAAVLGYLVLSGSPPPAERSAITAAVAFGAILVGRQAISLHALALAAMAVLLLQPEAVTQPGFQMSFAATAALVALAEAWPQPVREISAPWWIRGLQAVRTWTVAAVAVSLVAGLATAPFAMQHFNRISTWGLVANLASEPISSLVMMPGLALGAALSPFGLGQAPLDMAGFAIALMNRIATAIAGWPYAQLTVASGPEWTLAAAFLGLLWLCLWKGPLRWLGLPFAMAVSLVPKPATPDAWIAADGSAVAVRSAGQAVLFRPDVKLFGAELWARRRGLDPSGGEALRDIGYDCDHWSCAPRAGAPVRLAAAWNLRRPLKDGRIEALCGSAEVIVLRDDFPAGICPGKLVLTGAAFAAGGSAELYRRADGSWRAVWAQSLRGRRPWTWGPDLR
ncbi:ComEC/Rec2 family competence protein [Phenylobacterium soli]|uniref:Competence protein ComEC n=2 Tax=Phenylobacterium soli TaxID=2170551 RepID=A0A328AS40_9CAUL|nr:ComEC/Rec2 family competence protein [Phenylobacterium soli]RAK56344.1 competence protein ComEC [Phenylobacterium soli]